MTPHTTHLSALEALLFVSGEPLPLLKIEKILGLSGRTLEETVGALREKYATDPERGLVLLEERQAILLATKPEQSRYVEALSKSFLQETLSKAALEVLAIVAYRGPIARADIDAIRGVNCSFTLRNLLLRGLIDRRGNPDDGRGYVYEPTFRFLQTLGIGKREELPDYRDLSNDRRITALLETSETEESPI